MKIFSNPNSISQQFSFQRGKKYWCCRHFDLFVLSWSIIDELMLKVISITFRVSSNMRKILNYFNYIKVLKLSYKSRYDVMLMTLARTMMNHRVYIRNQNWLIHNSVLSYLTWKSLLLLIIFVVVCSDFDCHSLRCIFHVFKQFSW
jgi:hypothetical protein